MSKRRRWVLCLLGTLQLLIAGVLGWSFVFLHERVGTNFIVDTGHELVDSMKVDGAQFPDEGVARQRITETLFEIHDRQLGPLRLWNTTLVINGVFFIVFGLWPSKKPGALL